MPDAIVPPDQCQTMQDVRGGVDALDAALVRLLAQRFGYMRAAARIKQHRGAVRDETRKAEVLENAGLLARELGIPSGLVVELWDLLVEGSIAFELDAWETTHSPD